MASIGLDIRANTARALNEFKSFSRQLDNKFLISGLKIDSVKSALDQINREFQKALGDQNLIGTNSMRAIQNQNAFILNAYKGLGQDISASLVQDMSLGLNMMAKQTGATIDDVRKTLNASPLISIGLSKKDREKYTKDLLQLQTDLRRAGVSDNFSSLAQEFLGGRVSAGQLSESSNPLELELGRRLMTTANGMREIIPNAEERTRVFFEATRGMAAQAETLAKRTAGFRIVLEQLNATLFNQETGIFGGLRKILITGDKVPTTSFDETTKLIDSIFGEQGAFLTFFREIGEVFGLTGDSPLSLIIRTTRFITRQVDRLTGFFRGDTFENIVQKAKEVFDGISNFFIGLEEATRVDLMDKEPDMIIREIQLFGENIRKFIRSIGESIRETKTDDETGFAFKITSTIVKEITTTLGTLFSEIFKTLINKGPEIASGLLGAVQSGIEGIFKGIFGTDNKALLGLVLGAGSFLPGQAGLISRLGLGTTVTNPQNGTNWGELAAIGGLAFAPQLLRGARDFSRRTARAGRFFNTNRRGSGGAGVRNGLLQRLTQRFIDPNTGGNPFQRQVISLMEQILDCVCRGTRLMSGGTSSGGITPDDPISGRGRNARRRVQRRAGNLGNRILGLGNPARGRLARRNIARGLGRVGRFGLIAGAVSLLSGGAAQAADQQGSRRGVGEVASGIFNGALTGATIGSIIPGIGTGAGAAVGAVIGGIIPLMDKEVRENVLQFGKKLGETFSKAISDLGRLISNGWGNVGDRLGQIKNSVFDTLGGWGQALGSAWRSIDWVELLKKAAINLNPISAVVNLFSTLISPLQSFKELIGSIKLPFFTPTSPIQTRYMGQNSVGPELAKESRNSGQAPLIVNKGEFVIPPGGFSTLANMVSSRLPDRGGIQINTPVELNIQVYGGDSVAQIKEKIAPVVMEVINDAWAQARSGMIPRGAMAT